MHIGCIFNFIEKTACIQNITWCRSQATYRQIRLECPYGRSARIDTGDQPVIIRLFTACKYEIIVVRQSQRIVYGGQTRLRWVTHLDVSEADVTAALDCVASFRLPG